MQVYEYVEGDAINLFYLILPVVKHWYVVAVNMYVQIFMRNLSLPYTGIHLGVLGRQHLSRSGIDMISFNS